MKIGAILEVHSQEQAGPTITAQGWRVTPIMRVRRITWRGGKLLRLSPVAVAIVNEAQAGGPVRRIPVRDTTRIATLAVTLAACAVGGMGWWAARAIQQRRTS